MYNNHVEQQSDKQMGYSMIDDKYLEESAKLTGAARKVVSFLYTEMNDEDNIADITPRLRDKMRKLYSYADKTVSVAIRELRESNIIKEIRIGSYMLNPDYFCRCERKNIPKLKKEYEFIYNEKNNRKIKPKW